MSKIKSKEVKNIHGKKCGKKNHVPKEICSIIEKLERLDFVKHIDFGNHRNSNNGSGIKIIGYDEKSRNYHINVNTGKYEQRIILSVSEKKTAYEASIQNCI
ncbi:MAG: hypothetical protein ABIE36_00825 [Candidatus Diapherotrites archaeon]